jgi:hypothetical protein
MPSVTRACRALSLLGNSLHSAHASVLIVIVGLALVLTGNDGIDLTRPARPVQDLRRWVVAHTRVLCYCERLQETRRAWIFCTRFDSCGRMSASSFCWPKGAIPLT